MKNSTNVIQTNIFLHGKFPIHIVHVIQISMTNQVSKFIHSFISDKENQRLMSNIFQTKDIIELINTQTNLYDLTKFLKCSNKRKGIYLHNYNYVHLLLTKFYYTTNLHIDFCQNFKKKYHQTYFYQCNKVSTSMRNLYCFFPIY